MAHHTIDYADLIRKKGHRLTPQRELILDAVCEGGEHSTFDEIHHRLRAKSSSIDRSTIYRTLDFLCQMGLVVSSEIGSQRIYEVAVGNPHHHLICHSCGAERQIAQEALITLFDAIEREYNFTLDTKHLILSGLCEQCRRNQA